MVKESEMHLFPSGCPLFQNRVGRKTDTILLSPERIPSAHSTFKNNQEEVRATDQTEKVLSLYVHLANFPPPPALNVFPS